MMPLSPTTLAVLGQAPILKIFPLNRSGRVVDALANPLRPTLVTSNLTLRNPPFRGSAVFSLGVSQ